MKSAREWARDLKLTMGMAYHPPEPLLGNGKGILEATIEQIQLDTLRQCLYYANHVDDALMKQNLKALENKIYGKK